MIFERAIFTHCITKALVHEESPQDIEEQPAKSDPTEKSLQELHASPPEIYGTVLRPIVGAQWISGSRRPFHVPQAQIGVLDIEGLIPTNFSAER